LRTSRFALECVIDRRGEIRVEIADDGEVIAKIVGIGFDRETGAIGFITERSAKQTDVGPAFLARSVVIIITADLGAVLHRWSTAEIHAILHEMHSFQLCKRD
jgi:hypothetical protein